MLLMKAAYLKKIFCAVAEVDDRFIWFNFSDSKIASNHEQIVIYIILEKFLNLTNQQTSFRFLW